MYDKNQEVGIMAVYRSIFSIRLLRIALGVFFVILGILGCMIHTDEGPFSIYNSKSMIWIEVVFGICEIICGGILLIGFFAFTSDVIAKAGFVIFIFWLVRIFLTKFVWGFRMTDGGFWFYPAFPLWILMLACELMIACAVLVVVKRYE
jgi:hypothetical protein